MSSPSPPSPSSKPVPPWRATCAAVVENVYNDPSHPLQIAMRTYSLSLSLALGPIFLSTILASVLSPKSFARRARVFWCTLSNELRPTGFASAITAAASGGAALHRLWTLLPPHWSWIPHVHSKASLPQASFLANVISSTLAITLLRWKRRRRQGSVSPTLDLSLLCLVRALDALVQTLLLRTARKMIARRVQADSVALQPSDARLLDNQSEVLAREWKDKVSTQLDSLVFWASSARIVWCFFYQPQRLPPSFARWITSLANVDKRLVELLRALRDGTWSYIRGSPTKRDIVLPLAEELGRSSLWGDPTVLPAYGGKTADEVWKQLGVDGRDGTGGLPCELVHGGIGASVGLQNSCTANASIRFMSVFAQSFLVYLSVHFLPILLTNPSSILRPRRALSAFLGAIRSATFLSTLVSSCWFGVCFTRTLVMARLFPSITNDFWDGPYGGTLTGSLLCGTSIWIEHAKRRREISLYVLPKALRALIPEIWTRSTQPMAQFAEYLTFVLSLASLLTFSVHQPESLRGFSGWTLAFIMKGSSADLWKKPKKEIATLPPTAASSSIPPPASSNRAVGVDPHLP